jgi:hypothetical protein
MKDTAFYKAEVRWLVVLVACLLPVLLAAPAAGDYHRPEPFMNYVPQTQGVYDTTYGNFSQTDCRSCHGLLTGDLHRLSGPGLTGPCSLCHPDGTPDPGTQLDCTSLECHGIDPEHPDNTKRHHNGDLAFSGQCTACHQADLLGALAAEPAIYYPSGAAPTPFRCQNCHWESAAPEPDVFKPDKLHHMDFYGKVSPNCWDCHAVAPGNPSWDPNDPVLIRFCANCHTRDSLHAVAAHQAPEHCYPCHGAYVQNMPDPGARPPAIKVITPRSGSFTTVIISGDNFGTRGPDASVAFNPRTGDASGQRTPVVIPSTDPRVFAWNEQTISVQAPLTSPPGNYDLEVRTANGESNHVLFTLTGTGTAPPVPGTPVVTSLSPTLLAEDGQVSLAGSNFGDRHCCGREVYVSDGTYTVAMPVAAWTDTRVVVRIPAWTFPPGPCQVWLHNESGDSNVVSLTLHNVPVIDSTALNGLNLTLTGRFLGAVQGAVLPDHHGYASQVKFGTRQDTYTATHITAWTDTQIDLVMDGFVDADGDPSTALPAGEYGLVVETTYFYDTNLNGQFDPADQVFQVVRDAPVLFVQGDTGAPLLVELTPNPAQPVQIVSFIGRHFGLNKGKVKIGTTVYKPSNPRILSWSDTKVNFRLPAYSGQPPGTCRVKNVNILRKEAPGVFTPSNRLQLTICKP